MIERAGIPVVLVSLLTFALVETGLMTSGILITIGLNVALLLVVVQIIAMLYGFTKSLIIFNKTEQSPLYSPARASLISKRNTESSED